jgi:hypothetical protein
MKLCSTGNNGVSAEDHEQQRWRQRTDGDGLRCHGGVWAERAGVAMAGAELAESKMATKLATAGFRQGGARTAEEGDVGS